MKDCIKCNHLLPDASFTKRSCQSNICKKCTNEYQREHYQRNKQAYIDKARRNREKSTKRNVIFLIAYCKDHVCVDCGEGDFAVLHFDHVRGKKHKNVSAMVGGSLKKLKEEIAKCEVRCGNCHMKKTAKQFSYYKYIE